MRKYKYRYRDGGGVTKKSLEAFDKHISKVGTVKSIKGYLYKGKDSIKQIAVMITGDLGSVRLGGLSWGYNGEGCRGTRAIFAKLNVPQDETERVLSVKWDGWDGKPRVIWNVNLSVSVPS
jgi:hypothetical protein